MTALETRIKDWQAGLQDSEQEERDGTALSALFWLQSAIRANTKGSETTIQIDESYGAVRQILFAAVDEGQISAEAVTEWVQEQRDIQARTEKVFRDIRAYRPNIRPS